MVIRLLDYVKRCSTYEEGAVIFELVRQAFRKGEHAVISFDGVPSVPSAFVNAALIQLLDEFTFSEIRERLEIVDSTRQINELIRQRFDFALKQSQDPKS